MSPLDTAVTYTGLPQDDWEKAAYPSMLYKGRKSPQAASKACRKSVTFLVLIICFGLAAALLIPTIVSGYGKITSSKGSINQGKYPTILPPSNDFDNAINDYKVLPIPSKNTQASGKSDEGITKQPNKTSVQEKSEKSKSEITDKGDSETQESKKILTETKIPYQLKSTSPKPPKKTTPSKTSPVSPKKLKKSGVSKTNVSLSPTQSSANKSHIKETEVTAKSTEKSNASHNLSTIIDGIYKNGNSTSGLASVEDVEKWINDLMETQPSIEVAILGTVAVFLGLIFLVIGITCFRQRRKAMNRRVKFQDVVTDLQSPDKVVLLTSDLSEEE